MAGEIPLAIVGNLVRDPEIRFTPGGAAVCNFTVASTPRTLNRDTNKWEDGEATFMPVTAWRQLAENVAESVKQGDRVMVIGTMTTRSWEDRESGQKRSRVEMRADSVGPDLRFRTATVQRADRQQAQGGQRGYSNEPPADPWDQPPPSQQRSNQGQQQAFGDEPPF